MRNAKLYAALSALSVQFGVVAADERISLSEWGTLVVGVLGCVAVFLIPNRQS